jgi:CDP-diacylglycerol---serine O-phosphatidyltransferase
MEKVVKKSLRGRGIYLLPNLFTISALFAGFYAIVAALKGHYENAAVAIFVAMLMDSLDGRVARLTHTVTPFGAELDSLSDMVAFGIAPALVVYSWSLCELGKFGWLAAFIYAVAVALRLARFNTQIVKDKHYFQGLACTPAAGVLAGIILATRELGVPGRTITIFIALICILLGALMVSNLRYRSFKDLDLKNNVPFVVILIVVSIIVFISIDPPQVLFAIFAIYALSGPIAYLWQRHKQKKEKRKTIKVIKSVKIKEHLGKGKVK